MPVKKQKSYEFPEPIANAELVGHAAVQAAFIDAWNRKGEYPIHPVWMISGVRGIGKATLAYRIARFVFKESLEFRVESLDSSTGNLFGDGEPDINSTSQLSTLNSKLSLALPASDPVFQKMLVGGFGDFFIVDLAHNVDKDDRPNPDAKQISVYTIRALIDKMQLSSMEGAWRVVIIDSLDEMTTAASNAMLKLLEEPPAQTLFLMVAHSLANTLPTIRSRARVEKLHPLSVAELRDVARLFLPADEQDLSPALLKLAGGSFGRIANLKKNGGDELYEELLRVCANANATAAEVMGVAASIAKAPEMMGILSDAVAHFDLSELYPVASKEIAAVDTLHLEPEVAAFRVITEIRKRVVNS
ncbi:MAG: hypothetical protein FWC51_04840 [Proteobacteria bacterium]|nr:hypothetical protein [Pseudomonadota bacterium]